MGNCSICTGDDTVQGGLVVATLNYSGIANSPFEFYSDQLEKVEKELSQLFEKLLSEKVPNYSRQKFKWNLGKIDQKMQKERYTPIYQQKCGILKNRMIVSETQFAQCWTKQFSNAKIKFQCTQKQKQEAKNFDFLCYQSILLHVYKVKTLSDIDPKNVDPYQKFMSEFYMKAFLKEDKKIQKLIRAIKNQNISVMFLQQTTKDLIDGINKQKIFNVITNEQSSSCIVLRKSDFKKIDNQSQILKAFTPDLRQTCNWNNDTVIGFADKFIFISGHLSSKAEKNSQQLKKMFEGIYRLKTIYSDLDILVGCDANCDIKQLPLKEKLSLSYFPDNQSIKTTSKKRTMLQPQVSKSQIAVHERKDYLITTLKLSQAKVVSIDGNLSEKIGYLPCQKHPYDHFVVKGYLNRNP